MGDAINFLVKGSGSSGLQFITQTVVIHMKNELFGFGFGMLKMVKVSFISHLTWQ